MAAKKKYRRAGRRAKRTTLPARFGTGKNDLKREEKGLFGIGFGILFWIIMMVIAGVIVAAIPTIVQAIASNMEPQVLAAHVPYMVGDDPMMERGDPVAMRAGFLGMNQAMGDLYGQLRFIAMVVFVVVFIFIGVTYLLEQFKLVGEGTAHRMISESILFAILLFVFPLIFNLSARVVNSINESTILTSGGTDATTMAKDVAGMVADFPAWGPGGIGKVISIFVFGTFALTSVFTFVVAGVLRLFGTAAFAAAFPLVLVFYIFPLTRRVGEMCVSTLIGLMVATVFISIFFRMAWQAFPPGSESTLTKWIVGVGVLSAGAMLPTAFAPALGRTFSTTAHGVSSATGAAFGGTIAAAGGLAGGMVSGGAGGLKGMAGMQLGAGQQAKVVGYSAFTGGLKGMATKSPFGGFMVGAGTSGAAQELAKEMHGLPMSMRHDWLDSTGKAQKHISGFRPAVSEAELKKARSDAGPVVHGTIMEARKKGFDNLTHRQKAQFGFIELAVHNGKAPTKKMVEDVIDPKDGSARDGLKELDAIMQNKEASEDAVNLTIADTLKDHKFDEWYNNNYKK